MDGLPGCSIRICFRQRVRAEDGFKARLAAENRNMPAALAAYRQDCRRDAMSWTRNRSVSDMLEGGRLLIATAFALRDTAARAGEERPKPNGERLRGIHRFGKGLAGARAVFGEADLCRFRNTEACRFAYISSAGQFGADDPLVQKILAGKSPRERATELINGTKSAMSHFAGSFTKGARLRLSAAHDPMIELARLVDPDARALRKVSEAQGEAIEEAHAIIDRARNEIFGTSGYPDATFTLRLSFGVVKGYEEEGMPCRRLPLSVRFLQRRLK